MIRYLYPMTLSVIIVSYNVRSLLEQCLLSVKKASEDIGAEVFVVDNASADNTIEFLQPHFPWVRFIANERNEGFAKANNLALGKCTGEFILFLNPDTVVPADCFGKCISFLHNHPDAGALGVRMLDPQGHFLKESKRGLPTPMASFWKLTGISSLFPRSRTFAAYNAGHIDEYTTSKVDVLSGAFMMVRKDVLEKTGGFDERFFMYAEDIDLSYRILKAGYSNHYFAETQITHVKGASTKKDIRYVKQFYKAMSQFVRKHYGSGPYVYLLEAGIFVRGFAAALARVASRKKKSADLHLFQLLF